MRSAHLFLIVLSLGCSRSEPRTGPATSDQVKQRRRESEQAAKSYVPKVKGEITDLTMPASVILRQLPGVASVEVLVGPEKPTNRIIHVCDWHYVPKDLYALDTGLAAAEVDAKYAEFLLQVELVQSEQEAVLRCLIQYHGLRRVLLEGLTPPEAALYRDKIRDLHAAAPAIRTQLHEVRELLKELRAAGKESSERYVEAIGIEKAVLALQEEHRVDVLRFGAPGRLLAAGLVEVLPLDDADLLEKAKPFTPEGKVKIDAAATAARNDAQVRAALKSGPVAVIVLGGGHDLTPSVRRLGGGTTEYIRLATKHYVALEK